jgi:hypothetical protein
MYYSGFASAIKNGIGLATCPLTYPPTNWTKQGIIFAPNATAAQWDSGYIRMGNIFKLGSVYYLYYQGGPNVGGTGAMGFGLATSTDGISFTRSVYNPLVTLSGDETQLEDPTVVRVDSTHWYLYYCYRTAGATLPGIRVATSPDGLAWTKIGNVLNIGAAGTWDNKYIEHAQIYYLGGHYVLIYEAVGDLIGKPWSHGLAYSETPTDVFTKYSGNPFFTSSGVAGAFDQYHVATPYLFNHDSIWYLFFQGGNVSVPYGISDWKMGMAYSSYPESPPTIPNYHSSLQASFEYTIQGLKVSLKDTTYGAVSVRVWNFGDGIGSTNPFPTHKYANSGIYTIILTVLDEQEHSSTAMVTIEVDLGPGTPFEKTEIGWRIRLTDEMVIGVSATGLGIFGATMIVSTFILKEIPILTRKGRWLIGGLCILASIYFFVFVKGIIEIGVFG